MDSPLMDGLPFLIFFHTWFALQPLKPVAVVCKAEEISEIQCRPGWIRNDEQPLGTPSHFLLAVSN